VPGEPERAAGLVDLVLDRTVVVGYTRVGLATRRLLPGWPPDPPRGGLAGRSVLVTGAAGGLGLATAVGLAGCGARVHVVARSEESGARALRGIVETQPDADVVAWRCDVSDLDDVARCAADLVSDLSAAGERLSGVVHNAGVMPPRRTESAQGHELSMATHVLGPLLLTERLRPVLAPGARVVLVTSGGMYAQRLPADDPDYAGGEYAATAAYARSKRTQVALLPLLADRWPDLVVAATHPGWARTPGVTEALPRFATLTRPVLRDPPGGADTTVWLVATETPVPTGRLWHDRRPRPAHLLGRNQESDDERRRTLSWALDAARLER
jgi:NAD(P)-dependent dehydrogenase (short-subunit alcohol dehydrogenase family)